MFVELCHTGGFHMLAFEMLGLVMLMEQKHLSPFKVGYYSRKGFPFNITEIAASAPPAPNRNPDAFSNPQAQDGKDKR